MNKRDYAGIYGIVLTPFREYGSVDYETLGTQVDRVAQSKHLNGLVVCGSTGEFTRLRFEENVQLMETVAQANAGRKQLIFGATAGDSFTAQQYVSQISKLGADGILLAPPYYFQLTDEEILAYYAQVIAGNEASLPVIGYNIPQCTNSISTNLFRRLLEFDCLKGYKNSWNDLQQITTTIACRDRLRPDVAMFTGLDACLYGTLSLGGDGVFSAISYLMPDVMDFIYQSYCNGDEERAFQRQCDLLQLIDQVNMYTFPYGYRILSEAAGFPLGHGRAAVPGTLAKQAEGACRQMRQTIGQIRQKYGTEM